MKATKAHYSDFSRENGLYCCLTNRQCLPGQNYRDVSTERSINYGNVGGYLPQGKFLLEMYAGFLNGTLSKVFVEIYCTRNYVVKS